MNGVMTIGKLAAGRNISPDTPRYYEREGLLSPVGKSPGGYRLYDEDAIRRVRFIQHAQACDFTLIDRAVSVERLIFPVPGASRMRPDPLLPTRCDSGDES